MLTHEFLLLPERDGNYSAYARYINHPDALKLHDDLILYIMDTLKWIPSINPSNPDEWSGYGLNYHGPTVINKAGARKAARVFRLWAALLQEGPDKLELKGGFEWIEGDLVASGRYVLITVPRDSAVKTINDIAALIEKVISGEWYVLHIGV